ncbi:MAG: hypothetical protein K2X66_09380, partial [Cyanobacteria bacterium]|nr:hypothetical protein [Cyanobacteriota bacterium]
CLPLKSWSPKENARNNAEIQIFSPYPHPVLRFKGSDTEKLGPEEQSFLHAIENLNNIPHIENIIRASSKPGSYFFSLKDKKGRTALHTAIEGTENHWTIGEFLQLLKKFSFNDFNIQDREGFTPFALSCKLWNQKFIQILMFNKSVDRTIQDHQGKTALNHLIHRYHKAPSHEKKLFQEFISMFFKETPSPRILGKMDPTCYEGVIQLNFLPLIKLVMENHLKAWQGQHDKDLMFDSKTTSAPKNQNFEVFIYKLLQEAIVKDSKSIIEVVLDMYQPTLEHQDALLLTAMMNGKKEVVDQLQRQHQFQSDNLVESLQEWESSILEEQESKKTNRLLGLMPHVFAHEKAASWDLSIQSLLAAIKKKGQYIPSHPNESELLLMLNHKIDEPHASNTNQQIVYVLNSISNFDKTDTLITSDILENWANIGKVTHGFHRWQLESYGASSSLMGQYHREPIPLRNSDNIFGEGFLYKDPKGQFLIEFREGYIAITQENQGTLVIRNSDNPKYRQLMKHPAYFLDKFLTEDQLLNLNPSKIPENQHILHRRLYYPLETPQKIKTLLSHLKTVQESYGRFKLDTVKPKPNASTLLLLSESEGLKAIFKILKQLESQGNPLPDLAFIDPGLPIAPPYPFQLFHKTLENKELTHEDLANEALVGSLQRQFQVTPPRLEALAQILSGAAYSPDYAREAEEWVQFFEQAGFQKKGELVLISPNDHGGKSPQFLISED